MTEFKLIAKLLKLAERLVIDPAMNNHDGTTIIEYKDDSGILTIGKDRDAAMRDIVVELIRYRDMRETGE